MNPIVLCPAGNSYAYSTGDTFSGMIITLLFTILMVAMGTWVINTLTEDELKKKDKTMIWIVIVFFFITMVLNIITYVYW